ncbi:MAG TPA: hypothetical protein VFN62_10440 [Acidobacteriaceae bacterium]|nr:hypothetical protein [Acidobacteriaceae bacterium]
MTSFVIVVSAPEQRGATLEAMVFHGPFGGGSTFLRDDTSVRNMVALAAILSQAVAKATNCAPNSGPEKINLKFVAQNFAIRSEFFRGALSRIHRGEL